MPQIPLYKELVQATSNQGLAGASLGAASAVGDAIQDAAGMGVKVALQFQKQENQQKELQQKLEIKKFETESHLLSLDSKNRIGIAKNAYESGLGVRDDYAVWGTAEDEDFGKYQESIGEILSNPRLANHPDKLAELQIYAHGEVANAQIDANTLGVKELHNQTKAVVDVTFGEAVRSKNAELAIETIDSSPVHSDAEKAAMIAKVPALVDSQRMTEDVYSDPAQTIGAINNQLSGKETAYEHLSPEDLKSGKAYAKQILAERQQETMDEMYSTDQKYTKMSPVEKQEFIDSKKNAGLMTSSAWKRESDRIKTPPMAEVTPQDNVDYIEFQRKLFGASDKPDEMISILNDVTASGMPMNMRTQLYGLQKDIASPTGRTKSSSYGYARDTMAAVFGRQTVVADAPAAWKVWQKVEGFTEESQEMLVYRAWAEAEQELLKWMRTEKDFPNEAQINAKTYEIIGEKTKSYSLDSIPARLGEEVVAPPMKTEQPKENVETEVSDDDIINEVLGIGT